MNYITLVVLGIALLIPAVLIIISIMVSSRKYKDIYIRKTSSNDSALDEPKVVMKQRTLDDDTQTEVLEDEPDEGTAATVLSSDRPTELADDESKTVLLEDSGEVKIPEPGDVIDGKYRVERILGSGKQGSVFVCTNLKLGNQWAAKHFSGSMNEKDILVKLNHTCLPKISDLIKEGESTYIIESFVEGQSLEAVMKGRNDITEDEVIEWMVQICDALNYIHGQNVLHMDIKPANIVITNDNQAILIDFGIATHVSDTDSQTYKVYGYTQSYCPPEQMNRNIPVDERSDLFSLAATALHILSGHTNGTVNEIKKNGEISAPLIELISKCLSNEKTGRYRDARELKKALLAVKKSKLDKEKAIARNRYFRWAVLPFIAASTFLIATGYSQYSREKLMTIQVNVEQVILTEQEIQEVAVNRIYQDGTEELLAAEMIEWSVDEPEVAVIENGVIIGKNPGETTITGQYMNKIFSIDVMVDEGVLGVDISLKYNQNYNTAVYSGNGVRDIIDGERLEASYLEPISVAVTDKGTVYVADRFLRQIEDGQVTTVDTGIFQPMVVRISSSDRIMFSSAVWLNENDQYTLGLFEVDESGMVNELVSFPTNTSEINDFTFDYEDNIYILVTDYIEQKSMVLRIESDLANYDIIHHGEEQYAGIAAGEQGIVYLSQPESAVIYSLDVSTGELDYFAGAKYEKDFVDGEVIHLFEPYSLALDGADLYVMDHHVVRKIAIDNNVAVGAESISGDIEMHDRDILEGLSHEVSYSGGMKMGITIGNEGEIYLADNINHIIRCIEEVGIEKVN